MWLFRIVLNWLQKRLNPSGLGLQLKKRFHWRGQQLCKFIVTKKSFQIRRKSNFHRLVWNTNMAAVSLFGTPIWRTWRRAKTFYRAFSLTWPAVMQIYWKSDSFYMRKMFSCRRTGLRHQHGPRFIVLGHQYGGRDVMWKPQYPNTNSPDWSPCISVKNWLREFVCWSKLFPSVIILLILTRFSLDDVLIMLREDWLWFLLGT